LASLIKNIQETQPNNPDVQFFFNLWVDVNKIFKNKIILNLLVVRLSPVVGDVPHVKLNLLTSKKS